MLGWIAENWAGLQLGSSDYTAFIISYYSCLASGIIAGIFTGLTILGCQHWIDKRRIKAQCEKELAVFIEKVRSFINEFDPIRIDDIKSSIPTSAQKLIEAIRTVSVDTWHEDLPENKSVNLIIKARSCYYYFDEVGTFFHNNLYPFYRNKYKEFENTEKEKIPMYITLESFVQGNITFFLKMTFSDKKVALESDLERVYIILYKQAIQDEFVSECKNLYLHAREKLKKTVKELSDEITLIEEPIKIKLK